LSASGNRPRVAILEADATGSTHELWLGKQDARGIFAPLPGATYIRCPKTWEDALAKEREAELFEVNPKAVALNLRAALTVDRRITPAYMRYKADHAVNWSKRMSIKIRQGEAPQKVQFTLLQLDNGQLFEVAGADDSTKYIASNSDVPGAPLRVVMRLPDGVLIELAKSTIVRKLSAVLTYTGD